MLKSELEKSHYEDPHQVTPTYLKQRFLDRAAPLMDDYIDAALGKGTLEGHPVAQGEVWTVLREVILNARPPAPLLNLKGKSITGQVDEILTQVTRGEINFDEAKEFMSLVSAGFDLQTLPELMAKLEALESK